MDAEYELARVAWAERIATAEHGGAWDRADRLRREAHATLRRLRVEQERLQSGQGHLFEDAAPDDD